MPIILLIVSCSKPKSARTARIRAQRDPQIRENPKTALFLNYTKCSSLVQLAMKDLHSLKRPLAIRFNKKNDVHPFEDAASLEFFSDKNDASLLLFGSHSKKRPHALTFVRCFEHKVLDMLELLVVEESMRTLSQFKNLRKATVGLKPLVCFSGSAFESPTNNEYTLAKSMLLDFFKGPDVDSVDVEGLQYMISFSVGEESTADPKPKIHMRVYLIKTRKSGQRLPRVEVEEMGPRIDFRMGRMKESDEDMMKAALKKPKGSEVCDIRSISALLVLTPPQPKAKKNITTDLIGDKVGRIHVGKQDLTCLLYTSPSPRD